MSDLMARGPVNSTVALDDEHNKHAKHASPRRSGALV